MQSLPCCGHGGHVVFLLQTVMCWFYFPERCAGWPVAAVAVVAAAESETSLVCCACTLPHVPDLTALLRAPS